ncbi:MAG: transposase [Treponema sp.]|jgi:REP element-mobilizing transposase RayT|nr:transposase [Treponema sp.]
MRSLRTLHDGADYHVTSKIDHDDMSLLEPQFKALFLSFVKKAKRKFHFRLWDLCVMGNHIHFLIKPGEGGTLSEIMQWIKRNFAKSWNKAQGRKGHVWGERFYSCIIKGMVTFLRVREYIAENPVKAGIAERAAERVRELVSATCFASRLLK